MEAFEEVATCVGNFHELEDLDQEQQAAFLEERAPKIAEAVHTALGSWTGHFERGILSLRIEFTVREDT